MKDFFNLTTYSKIILGSWTTVFNMISKYTRIKKQKNVSNLPLVSQTQLDEVFSDPHSEFIQHAISTKAQASLTILTLTQQIQAVEKQKHEAIQGLISLENYLNEEKENIHLQQSVHTARELLTEIKNTEKALENKKAFFDMLSEKLDKVLSQQDHEWEDFRDHWATVLIEEMEAIGIRLTALEQEEIKRQKTMPELIQRMRELGIALPKNLSKKLLLFLKS